MLQTLVGSIETPFFLTGPPWPRYKTTFCSQIATRNWREQSSCLHSVPALFKCWIWILLNHLLLTHLHLSLMTSDNFGITFSVYHLVVGPHRFMALWTSSGTTWVSQYQKKHWPTDLSWSSVVPCLFCHIYYGLFWKLHLCHLENICILERSGSSELVYPCMVYFLI